MNSVKSSAAFFFFFLQKQIENSYHIDGVKRMKIDLFIRARSSPKDINALRLATRNIYESRYSNARK